MPPNTNTTTGVQADPNNKDFQDGLLREIVTAESDPANKAHIDAVSLAMRNKMNQVLKAAGVKSSMGNQSLHMPVGSDTYEVRENLTAKELVNAVNFVTDDSAGLISTESRKQLFEILNNGLAPTRVAKPVTVEEEVADAVKKSDDADKKKKEEEKMAAKAWYNPKRWWNWIGGKWSGEKKEGAEGEKAKEDGKATKVRKWVWKNFITHMDVFDDFWSKNPNNYKNKEK